MDDPLQEKLDNIFLMSKPHWKEMILSPIKEPCTRSVSHLIQKSQAAKNGDALFCSNQAFVRKAVGM